MTITVQELIETLEAYNEPDAIVVVSTTRSRSKKDSVYPKVVDVIWVNEDEDEKGVLIW